MVSHFNQTSNKASSLPLVTPVAKQCCEKDSQAIHHLLLCCLVNSTAILPEQLGHALVCATARASPENSVVVTPPLSARVPDPGRTSWSQTA